MRKEEIKQNLSKEIKTILYSLFYFILYFSHFWE